MENTRKLMIKELIRYELYFLIDNKQELENVAEFFFNKGFSKYSDEQLTDLYITKILD
jgi:hypothetical protein